MYEDPTTYVEDAMGYSDEESETTYESSVDTLRKKQRKNLDDVKKMDKNYHKITRRVKSAGSGKMVKKSMEIYTSSCVPGATIRDAINGTKQSNMLVGSASEYLFFTVKFATGEVGNDCGSCFFNSPEEYERHMHSTVSETTKNDWRMQASNQRALMNNNL
jgi:hypothetical protein